MDIDDPIQQFLKNTGWSCDDLLEKLQRYKSQKENKKDLVELSEDPDKGGLTSEKPICDVKEVAQENDSGKETVAVEKSGTTSNICHSKSEELVDPGRREEFSDTDDEEVEVNVTQSSIVNEIIDDIGSAENIEDQLNPLIDNDKDEAKEDFSAETEITEVRVIEIDDGDDCFDEGNTYTSTKRNSKSYGYLETFPRKSHANLSSIDLTRSEEIAKIFNNESNEEEYSHEENIKLIDCNKHLGTLETKDTNFTNKNLLVNEKVDNKNNTNDSLNLDMGINDYTALDKTTKKLTVVVNKNKNKTLDLDMETNDCNAVDETPKKLIVVVNKNNCKTSSLDMEINDYNAVDGTPKKLTIEDSQNSVFEKNEDHVQEECPEEKSPLTNLEDIRNNLKLQLSCLRTRKKGHFLQQLRTKVVETSNTDKKNSNTCTEPSMNLLNTSFNPNTKSSKATNEERLYTQTNEFGLVILSVEGGIDLEEQSKEKCAKSNKQTLDLITDNSFHTNTSTLENSMDSNNVVLENQDNKEVNDDTRVFDEIRKIIRKQRHNSLNEKRTSPIGSDSNFKKAKSDLNFFAEKNKSNDRIEFSYTSTENSQSSFTNDDTNQTADKNSPFVSNTLDEFLTENSKLNISYNVPKCDAEEGLMDNYHEESPLIVKKMVALNIEQTHELNKPEKIKAKTVAQKRKLLEKQRQRELRKELKMKRAELKEQSKENSMNQNQKQSYVEVNNRKLWVRATEPNTCVARINSVVQLESPSLKHHPPQKRKLSLLTELGKKMNEKIKYLPGPLSKKFMLQVTGHDNWKTETKPLPKIILEVYPEIGYSLPPSIIRKLPQTDGFITADIAEFALSVLKTKNDTNSKGFQVFKFPMKYINGQEKIIVKKKKIIPFKVSVHEETNGSGIDGIVKSVIDDLIRYVEIKEIAPTLIKEEETEYTSTDITLDKLPKIAENISSIIKKTQKKKSKVELELLRLNCKVVNVEVEENSTEESCNKPYCQLGCVCKSLKCDGLITYHCQKVGCMLECKCPREKSIEFDKLMLPAGTDILSKDTVTRIEDEAKKDLAKVEREFTQMVIHTNDKTIVVGTGGRHKTKRSTKTPLKYSDYINSSIENIEKYEKPKPQEKSLFFDKACVVSLEQLNLRDIVPYCLLHNLYNCYCQKNSLSPISGISADKNLKSVCDENTEKKTVEKTSFKNIKSSPSKQPKVMKEFKNSDVSPGTKTSKEATITSTSGRTIRSNKKLKEDFAYFNELDFQLTSCARTLGIPYHRPVDRKSVKELEKTTKNDFSNLKFSQSDILKAKTHTSSSNELEVDILKRQLILEVELHKKTLSLLVENSLNEMKHKRKQILEVRKDDTGSKTINKGLAIQRRKKSKLVNKRKAIIQSVFDGEIIIDERNMELLQKMGSKTVMEGYARLLPWTALINSFNKGDINIWCMIDQPSRLLINKSEKTPPKNYIDIRQTTQSTEVILWILSNKLPERYHENHVSFILKQTKDNYEICGLCTKNLDQANSSTDNNTNIDTKPLEMKHKDLNGTQQSLYVIKAKFKLQELMEENLAPIGETSMERNKLYMWAALPEIYAMCKWRMIFLNSDFSFLYFTKVKYSIKYTDLLNASNKAREANCTVILRNAIIRRPYDHTGFGIYFDPHYQDRLFIGPYFKQFVDNDIETLRYINKSLVCTESFNKMQGKIDYKCGHWLIERPYSRSRPTTIDLTDDSLKKTVLKRKRNNDLPKPIKKPKCEPEANEETIVSQDSSRIRVLDSKPRKPEEFNRYIITNIPHLGYLGAFQHDDSTEIDVSWPFENKMLRFPSVNSATEFLQCRFSSLLQPIPETFRISIIVMTNIDLNKTKPIDASILSGHYICGEFGCYNVKTLTQEFCSSKLSMTREELLRIFARRAQMFVKQKINELADLVNIPKTEKSRCDIVNVLNVAKKDIQTLKGFEKHYIEQKRALLLRKRELALKAFSLISVLPEDQRKAENSEFRKVLRKQSLLLPKPEVETIEITDSDEEEKNTSSQNESTINLDVQNNTEVCSKAGCSSSGGSDFKEEHSDFAKITPISKPDPVEDPFDRQCKMSVFEKNISDKVMF